MELPEDFEIAALNHILALIDDTEELFAIHNAIAGGLVTDSETIMNTSARTAKRLEEMLIAHREMLKNGGEAELTADIIHAVYRKD